MNAWIRKAELGDQMAIEIEGVETADFTVVRELLVRGRGYEQAVDIFEPYETTQEVNGPARKVFVSIGDEAIQKKRSVYA